MKTVKECLRTLSEKNIDTNINRTIKILCEQLDDDQLEYKLTNGVKLDNQMINLYFLKNVGFKCDNIWVEKYGHLPICNFIEKTLNQTYKSENKPKRTEFPFIFNGTLYRIPTNKELQEFERYPDLTPQQVLDEFKYICIGKGILNLEIKNQICDCIQKLIGLYPDDLRYKESFLLAKGLTGGRL